MRTITLLAVITLAAGCSAHHSPAIGGPSDQTSRRLANLKRAAVYPWTDDGKCVVREASNEWGALIDKCQDVLDWSRLRFQNHTQICKVADADGIAVEQMVGVCLLAQPEIAVAAVVIVGAVVVAAAIVEALQNMAPAPSERCKQVATSCREYCSETTLPTKTGDSFAFWNCVNACLERQGCTPGMY